MKKINTLGQINGFFLFMMVIFIIIDPSNQLIHLKDIFFILFIITGINKIKTDNWILIFPLFLGILFTVSLASFSSDFYFDNDFWFTYVKAFFFLIFLFWIRSDNIFNIFFVAFITGCVLVGCLTVFIYIINIYIPRFSILIVENNLISQFLSVSERNFMGKVFFSVYYKTVSLLVISSSVMFYWFLIKRKKLYFIFFVLFIMTLFFSGTRANMLMGGFSIGVTYLLYLLLIRQKVYKFLFLNLFVMFIFLFFSLYFLKDSGEVSISIKTRHIESLLYDFKTRGLFSFLFGVSPGRMFFSTGHYKWTLYTELTYLEILRMFGVLGGGVILLCFYIPVIKMIINIMNGFFIQIPFCVSYFSYLIIGATNPLFIGSTGFIVLMFGYMVSNKRNCYEMSSAFINI